MRNISRVYGCFLGLLLLALPIFTASACRGGSTGATFNAERAYQDLVAQCDFGPRVPGTKAHARGAAWLVSQFRTCTNSVVKQTFTQTIDGKELQLTNIIATLNPKGAPSVLLAAHWDSRPHAEQDPDPAKRKQAVLGANDGASGVAVLLELARALQGIQLQQKIVFVLFDGEDYGTTNETMFLGSRYYAKHYQDAPPAWAALLDMVGDKDLRIPVEAYSRQKAPQVVERLWSAARRADAPAFVNLPGPAIRDDHLPLLQHGIPCINIIDFDYPYWHTTADTPDKCAADSLGQVGRTLLEAILRVESRN